MLIFLKAIVAENLAIAEFGVIAGNHFAAKMAGLVRGG
jgi:hypothetical protein